MLTCAVLAIAGAACLTASAVAEPPVGRTTYGRLTWNLDALLHDTFGSHSVYVNYAGSSLEGSFSTRFIDEARSRYYLFTFAAARGSAFRVERPARPPKPVIGVAGSAFPLRLSDAYISCGGRKWLFEHTGQGAANWELFCHP